MSKIQRIVVTGGTGFVGSHVVEHFARKGAEVVAVDNLSRGETLATARRDRTAVEYNWNHLARYANVRRERADVRKAETVDAALAGADAVVHAAAQVAVTTAVKDPRLDFEINVLGTLNVLEAARKNDVKAVVYCSTNKVYGENVNAIPLRELSTRYAFADKAFENGVPETLSVDHCEHTPYGVSKLAGDLYCQDYARLYGIRTGVFRMSCIYGTRQFGNEDQGWVAHFIHKTLRGEPLTIFGDGKQVRDVLFVTDLVKAYEAFLDSGRHHGVWNTGGGAGVTTSLLELLELLARVTGKRSPVTFADWRPSDQKVYVSDVRRIATDLDWRPTTSLEEGVRRFLDWHATLASPAAVTPR